MAFDIAAVLDRYPRERRELLDILWEIQRANGHISAEDARAVGDHLGLAPKDVLETATFYHFFRTAPTSQHCIYLANTVVAKMNGYHSVRDALEAETEVSFGGPGSAEFSLFETACIGLSDQEPAMLIDDVVFTRLTPDLVATIVANLRQGRTPQQIANPGGVPRTDIAYLDVLMHTTVRTAGPVFFAGGADEAAVVRACRALRPEDVLATITGSGLRGRGGAGFPTGTKWRLCRDAAGEPKYVICNADEGEPGTFKDRVLLTRSPREVLAGMAIAAHAVGAGEGLLYLRAEYCYLLEYLEAQLADLRADGVLGDGFDIRIQLGAGAYVCGDETSLLESAEGKRGSPRVKPPFPVEHGFLGRPTVVNNVETFAAATRIMEKGADWFAGMGVPGSEGTRLLNVAGDCATPGIYEVEWGVTLGEVLTMIGATDARAVVISGPSGEVVSAEADADRTLAHDDIACNGSFTVVGAQRDLLAIVRDCMQFFVEESCGICVPCRVGNVLLRDKVDLFLSGRGARSDIDDMVRWGAVVAKTSRCGLGGTSPNPILSTLKKFPEIYQAGLAEPPDELLPSFDEEAVLTDHALALTRLAPRENR